MRVLTSRLLAVLESDQGKPQRRVGGHVVTRTSSAHFSQNDSDVEASLERSTFDMMHCEKGFNAFDQWYKRVLASVASGQGGCFGFDGLADAPPFWNQIYCPPNLLHEHAWVELLRTFVDCSDSEAYDFFDILDSESLAMIGMPQVYVGMCLIAALGSRQLTKFLYFHSTRMYKMLAVGCRLLAPPGCVTWPKLVSFLRIIGTPGYLISRAFVENNLSPLANIKYEEFLDVIYPIAVHLDGGSEIAETTHINESERVDNIKSRMCTVL
eukprot:TRINITY_DN61239_c0_g1_i1.p1 TRINITY_DN61239_c0_g1~~TRINITY_DN61239_c0_g1_i1.p1  ORF type:complete len:268 (-),score=35.49 TRINITY_DN61239_c0_g1_i1:16-819(-)